MSNDLEQLDDITTRHMGATSLLLTMLGEFVFPTGGSVWTSTVVRGLETVGITERNARQAVARLGDQGLVEAHRHGRRTQWHLSDRGARLLAAGTDRIYSFGRRGDDWEGSWLLVICSIPETLRAVRHQFRTQLTFEGFGFLSPTIAVSPHVEREKAANEIVEGLGLADSAVTFVSTTGTLTSDETVLASAWDLEALTRSYRAFMTDFDVPEARPDGDGAEAFGTMLRLVDVWRRFPFVDPELPSSLLPETWIGTAAHELFDRRRAAQRPLALDWYTSLERDA